MPDSIEQKKSIPCDKFKNKKNVVHSVAPEWGIWSAVLRRAGLLWAISFASARVSLLVNIVYPASNVPSGTRNGAACGWSCTLKKKEKKESKKGAGRGAEYGGSDVQMWSSAVKALGFSLGVWWPNARSSGFARLAKRFAFSGWRNDSRFPGGSRASPLCPTKGLPIACVGRSICGIR